MGKQRGDSERNEEERVRGNCMFAKLKQRSVVVIQSDSVGTIFILLTPYTVSLRVV